MASMISSGWPAATASPSFTDRLTIVPCIGAGTAHRALRRVGSAQPRPAAGRGLAEGQHGQRIDRIDLARRPAGAPARRRRGGLEIEPGCSLAAAAISFLACSSMKRVWTLSARTSLCGQQRAQEGDVAGRAFQPERRQRPLGPRQRRRRSRPTGVHDHLGQQRIEVGIGAVAGIAVAVDAHARARRRLEDRERAAARLGRAVGRHGLQVDAQLDRMAARRGARRGRPWPGHAARQQQLRLHQVDAPHLLGDGVLDLQARIGLDEEELVARRPGTRWCRGCGSSRPWPWRRRRRRSSCAAPAQVGAGRQLDDLLAAPLQAAFALAQGHDAALAVAHDLHLDVARAADQPLGIEVAVAERRLGLGRGAREGVGDLALAA